MSKPDSIPIYRLLYQQQLKLYKLVHNFTREYKFSLGQDILNLSWRCLDLVIKANKSPNQEKKTPIKEAIVNHSQLIIRLRMAHELKLLSDKQYSFLIKNCSQISKMLQGWHKWAKKPKQNVP